ncbi:hypothetical protein BDV38DRAFT_252298 [Aspergillus pseudotamarii]|uniref:Uncharacterized protein n=1 Tax=Aspergillus pseudotamarii TaxID=132259 RepID=A0A5N6SNT8_ASPPS|nr:uncharacterized protein BDV38DRAFT_252298 [Aspergillus pseudotamarii]KAE8135440.1 hypothetical protein BDV38DRAFT_252298 [Aspergillus pseudotamarii]
MDDHISTNNKPLPTQPTCLLILSLNTPPTPTIPDILHHGRYHSRNIPNIPVHTL